MAEVAAAERLANTRQELNAALRKLKPTSALTEADIKLENGKIVLVRKTEPKGTVEQHLDSAKLSPEELSAAPKDSSDAGG